MTKTLNIKTYTILQNGIKHLSKSKNLFFTKNVTSSPWRMTSSPQFMI